MTRLSSYQQKQFRKKLVFYVLLILSLAVLLLTFGLRLLIDSTLLISSVISDKKVSQTTEKKDLFYGTLYIDDIPVATNSATITISGSAINFEEIEFYLNDEKVKKISLQSSESFIEEIADLKLGTNEIYLKAKTKKTKDVKKSEVFSILYKNEKPKLEITEPADSAKTTKPDIIVAGKTDAEISVRVNGLSLVINSDNKFQTTVSLKPGDNEIVITAEDIAGNIESKTIKVNYQKDD